MKTQLPFLCAALILLPSIALAAPARKNAERNDEGAAVTDNGVTREVIFDDDDNVDGEVMRPNGVNVGGRRAAEHANMIGIRGQFIPELIKLSNDV